MDLKDTTLHTFTAISRQGTSEGSDMSLDEKRAELKKTAKEFESIFMFQMVSAMRKTVPQNEGGLIKKSNGEKIFEGMLDEEWAKRLSGKGQGGGLSGVIYQQLSRKLGLETSPTAPVTNQGMPLKVSEPNQLLPAENLENGLLQLQQTGAMRLDGKDPSEDNHE